MPGGLPAITESWWVGLFVLLGLAWCARAWRKRTPGSIDWSSWAPGIACVAVGLGGWLLPANLAGWLSLGAGAALVTLLLLLILTGFWLPALAAPIGLLLLLGLGGWLVRPAGPALIAVARTLAQSDFAQPWWLLGLLVLPALVALSFRSLAGLGPIRRVLAIALRCLLVTLLIFALAELRLRKPNDTTTVFFLIDRSLSIPQDMDPDAKTPVDRRWTRIKKFVGDAVAQRGPGHELDQSGVICFGRRPRLVLPASNVPRLPLDDTILSGVDATYTDIAAAVKLALASFPEGSGRRIVLISDGNENLGNFQEQVRIAQQNGVEIDVVPLATGYRNENEVLVERVEAPPMTEQGARLPIRVLVRSYNPRPVAGALRLEQLSDGLAPVPVAIEAGPGVRERGPPAMVELRPGLNSFSFRQSLEAVQRSYTYQAIFQPTEARTESGEWQRGLPGDRVQNNSASTHVVALGRRRVLFVEANGKPDEHRHLIERLAGGGGSKFNITALTSDQLPLAKSDLGLFLSNFDCVVLGNVPAEELSEDQQEMIRSNTSDQGCGLVVIGGRESYGAGGYQSTPIEKALPVDCEIKSIKVAGKGGLVLIMHACEADNGNALQKQIAKLAIQKLGPSDMVGIIYYDFSHRWHIPFQDVGVNRPNLLRAVDRMTPGDMPDFDTSLQMATSELSNPKHQLATKHIIVISDGDPRLTNPAFLQQMKTSGVTCTTVGVATHGAPENQRMTQIASSTGGKAYLNPPPRAIPAIYIRESRLVSQSFVVEQRFVPRVQSAGGPSDKLGNPLPPLYGFVRTSLKPSPLVEMGIEGPPLLDQRFPILASWQYGLGKSVAFTSDARSQEGKLGWDRDWAGSEIFLKFWEQVLSWALRGVESGKLTIASEFRDGKVRVTIDARDEKNRPMTDLRLQGLVTAPNLQSGENRPLELKYEQKSSGQYEAEFKAEEAGSYFINTQARRTVKQVQNGRDVEVEEVDSIRSGVTLPYSPEFADLESNTALLIRAAESTGGRIHPETDATLAEVSRSGRVFRKTATLAQSPQPMWYWLVALAALGLVFDVGVRRIAVEPHEAAQAARKLWNWLRSRGEDAAAGAEPQFLERLKSRKAQVVETIDRSAARFEGVAEGDAPPIVTAETRPVPPRPQPHKPAPPAATEEREDPFARLMKAKKRALGDREPPTEPPS